jgi:hypothetical protein
VGAVLSQRDEETSDEWVIAYASKKLTPVQQRFGSCEGEAWAVVWAVQHFRAYLWMVDIPFLIVTDNASISWLARNRDMNGRLGRWALKLQQYRYEVMYRKGTQNGNADALSRVPFDEDEDPAVADMLYADPTKNMDPDPLGVPLTYAAVGADSEALTVPEVNDAFWGTYALADDDWHDTHYSSEDDSEVYYDDDDDCMIILMTDGCSDAAAMAAKTTDWQPTRRGKRLCDGGVDAQQAPRKQPRSSSDPRSIARKGNQASDREETPDQPPQPPARALPAPRKSGQGKSFLGRELAGLPGAGEFMFEASLAAASSAATRQLTIPDLVKMRRGTTGWPLEALPSNPVRRKLTLDRAGAGHTEITSDLAAAGMALGQSRGNRARDWDPEDEPQQRRRKTDAAAQAMASAPLDRLPETGLSRLDDTHPERSGAIRSELPRQLSEPVHRAAPSAGGLPRLSLTGRRQQLGTKGAGKQPRHLEEAADEEMTMEDAKRALGLNHSRREEARRQQQPESSKQLVVLKMPTRLQRLEELLEDEDDLQEDEAMGQHKQRSRVELEDSDPEDHLQQQAHREASRLQTRAAATRVEDASEEGEQEESDDPFEDIACQECGAQHDAEVMLICDGCDKGYHTYCLEPPLESIPDDDWHCPACQMAPSTPTLPDALPQQINDYQAEYDIMRDEASLHYLQQGTYQLKAGLNDVEKRRERLRIRKRATRYFVHGRHVWRKPTKRYARARRVPPLQERTRLLQEYHDKLAHGGVNRTMGLLQPRIYWPGMSQDCKRYIAACHHCQLQKAKFAARSTLHPLPITKIFGRAHIDMVGPLPETARGNKYIVVLVDSWSKWIEAAALPDKSSDEISRFFMERVIAQHGVPETLVSDRGREFAGKLDELCQEYNVKRVHSSAYHPISNGGVERANATLQRALLKMVNEEREKWDEALPVVLLSYRVSTQSSIKFSPFYLVYGREPMLAEDLRLKREVEAAETAEKAAAAAVVEIMDDDDDEDGPPERSGIIHRAVARTEVEPRKPLLAPEFMRQRSMHQETAQQQANQNLKQAQDRMIREFQRRTGQHEQAGPPPEGSYVMLKKPKKGKLTQQVEGPYYLERYNTDKTVAVLKEAQEGKTWKVSTDLIAPYDVGNLTAQGQHEQDENSDGRHAHTPKPTPGNA